MPHYNISFINSSSENATSLLNNVGKIQEYKIDPIADNTFRIICPYAIGEVVRDIQTNNTNHIDFMLCYTYCATAYCIEGTVDYYRKDE